MFAGSPADNDFSHLSNQLLFTLVDATISGIFSYAKKGIQISTTKGIDPDKADTFLKGISNDRIYKIVLDVIIKELQFPIKAFEKIISHDIDPGIN